MKSSSAYSGLGLGVDSTIDLTPATANMAATSTASAASSTAPVASASSDEQTPTTGSTSTSTDDQTPILEAAGPRLMLTIDTKNMILSEKMRLEVMRIQTWWEATERQVRRGQFRLLDLPAELRNRVYGYTITTAAPLGQSLQKFALPSIILACRQMRKEILPLFFSQTAWTMEVEADFANRKQHRINGTGFNPIANRSAGQPRIPNKVRNLFANTGPDAVIHDLTIKVKATWEIIDKPMCVDDCVVAYIHLRVVSKGVLQVTTANGPDHPSNSPLPGLLVFQPEDVVAALSPAVNQARTIGRGKKFVGLKLSHICQVVQKLRFQR